MAAANRNLVQLPKADVAIESLAGKRVGVEGNWFIKVVRSHLKRHDPFWALQGPISPAIKIITTKFLKKLESHNITPVFVFDGLYTRRQAHPAVLLHRMNGRVDDVMKQVRELEPLDEDAICYILRLLVSLRVEVVTAPYLAWAQLAYFNYRADGSQPFIAEIFGALDVLAVGPVKRVITEIGNLDDNNAKLTAFSCTDPLHALNYITAPGKIAESPHWSWLQHSSIEEDVQHVKSTLEYCPVLCFDGTLQSVCKVTSDAHQPGILRQYFYNDLGSKSPLLYFLLSANIVSPQLLTVAAAEQFIDDPPFIQSNQYKTTLERILPLRTQIVFQLVQELERYLRGFEQIRKLNWERPHEESQPSLPIQRPPKIALDEWDNIDENPAAPYNFRTVLTFSSQAHPVEENVPVPPVTYKSSEQALGAVLLKSLDLLGYFTHAAHTSTDAEESSMSIFAQALDAAGHYGSECVLLIELTRTRSLHDSTLTPNINSSLLPKKLPANLDGARYAARIMSLLRLDANRVEEANMIISADLLAFNDIARSFQRSLRLLSEAIAATQVLNHTAAYPLHESRDFAARLPFSVPLTIHAGLVLEYMLTSPDYGKVHDNARNQHLKDKFPHIADMAAALRKMKDFWTSAMKVVCKLLEDEEAEDDFYTSGSELVRKAHKLVSDAFRGVTQIPALPDINPPQIA